MKKRVKISTPMSYMLMEKANAETPEDGIGEDRGNAMHPPPLNRHMWMETKEKISEGI